MTQWAWVTWEDINLEDYQFDLSKVKKLNEDKIEAKPEKRQPTVTSVHVLKTMMIKPGFFNDVNDAVKLSAQNMTEQAELVMRERLSGLHPEHSITQDDYEQFLVDSLEMNKLLIHGYIRLTDLFAWLNEAINQGTDGDEVYE